MEPTREDDTIVDLLDVLLRDGAMIQADVIVTVADIPLIGINLRAAIAGMATMREYGFFEDWDAAIRAQRSGDQRAASRRGKFVPQEESGRRGGPERVPPTERPGQPMLSSDDRTPPSKRPGESGRPFQTTDDDSTRSKRPHDGDRPGSPERSSLSKRPFEGDRPKGLDLGDKSTFALGDESAEAPSEDDRKSDKDCDTDSPGSREQEDDSESPSDGADGDRGESLSDGADDEGSDS